MAWLILESNLITYGCGFKVDTITMAVVEYSKAHRSFASCILANVSVILCDLAAQYACLGFIYLCRHCSGLVQ